MEIFFIIIAAIVIAMVANSTSKPKRKPPCKMHKWVYDIAGHLYCSECKNYPGDIQTDYDKPY